MIPRPPSSTLTHTLVAYPTVFRSGIRTQRGLVEIEVDVQGDMAVPVERGVHGAGVRRLDGGLEGFFLDHVDVDLIQIVVDVDFHPDRLAVVVVAGDDLVV